MFNFLADKSVKTIDKNNLDSYTAYLVHKSMNLLSLARFETDWLIMMFQCHIMLTRALWVATSRFLLIFLPVKGACKFPDASKKSQATPASNLVAIE